ARRCRRGQSDHGQGRGRLAQGPEGVRRDAARHQVLRRRGQQEVLRHQSQPGPALPDRQGRHRRVVRPRQDPGEDDAQRSYRLRIRQRMIASFLEAYTAPRREIPRRVYLTVSALVGLGGLLAWCALSYGGLVRSGFLPTPVAVLQAGIDLARGGSLLVDPTARRPAVTCGFILASVISVPFGVLMGSFKIV